MIIDMFTRKEIISKANKVTFDEALHYFTTIKGNIPDTPEMDRMKQIFDFAIEILTNRKKDEET